MPIHHDEAKPRLRRGLLSRILALCLAFVFVLGAVPQVGAITKAQIEDLKKQQQQLNASKAALQQKLSAVENDKEQVVQKKYILEERIGVLNQDIQVTDNLIQSYNKQIEDKTAELEAAQAEEARYYDLFCERVRSMEEGGEVSYWAVLFNASDFADLIDRINVIGEVMDHDDRMMDQLAAAKAAVAEAKAGLEEARAGQVEAKKALETSKAELVKQEQQLEDLLNQLKASADQYSKQINETAEDSADLSQDIAAAEKQYEEQLRKQAEEQRKQAEEQRRKQQAAKNNSSSSNSSSNSSSGGSTASLTGSGGFIWPLPGHTDVISKFGPRIHPISGKQSTHGGVDVPAASGTTIIAAKSGTVVISGYNSSYGNYVVIAHGDGTKTLYAHMKARACAAGDSVSQGQKIGYVGTTGSSTGNHLHFEVWLGSSSSTRTNPMKYF